MDLYTVLSSLQIEYQQITHPPVYTVADAQALHAQIDGVGCKNLLLTDKKGQIFYLLLLEENKKADLKAVARLAGLPHLRFATEEELMTILSLVPGSVSPFGLLNDPEHRVTVLMDSTLRNQRLLCHPNVNTSTLSVHYDDLLRFFQHTGHEYLLFSPA
jgi:Ala-tRNA(Pro) deacylase